MMFSVVIPAYNAANHLQRSVGSILNQTYEDYEIIIVNDGSTDGTLESARTFQDDRVIVIDLESNQGVHSARNAGIEKAKGKFIFFLDADDELLPECMERFFQTIESEKSIEIGLYSCPYITSSGELTGLDIDTSGIVPYEDLLCLKYSRRLKPGLALVRTDIARRYRFVAPNLDFIFFRRVMKSAPLYYIVEPLAIYHIVDDAASLHVKRKKLDMHMSIKRTQALETFLEDFEADYRRHCPEIFSTYLYGYVIGSLLQFKYYKSLRASLKAMRYSRFRGRYTLLFLIAIIPIIPSLLLRSAFYLRIRI